MSRYTRLKLYFFLVNISLIFNAPFLAIIHFQLAQMFVAGCRPARPALAGTSISPRSLQLRVLLSNQHQSHIELLDGCHWYRLQTQQGYFEHTPGN